MLKSRPCLGLAAPGLACLLSGWWLAKLAFLLSTLVLTAAACEPRQQELGPEQVVQEFVERMERVHGDPQSARAAWALLWSRDRQVLAERARRASAVAGRKLGPEEMIAPSRFVLRFSPQRYVSALVDAQHARVSVYGPHPGQIARVDCVAEQGLWRVALNLPELPPILKRRREPPAKQLP